MAAAGISTAGNDAKAVMVMIKEIVSVMAMTVCTCAAGTGGQRRKCGYGYDRRCFQGHLKFSSCQFDAEPDADALAPSLTHGGARDS
jgi:hypothetical protein